MNPIKQELSRCSKLNDEELWAAVPRLIKHERNDIVGLLIHLGEIEKRELHLMRAYSSLFRYLQTLGYSDWESRARSIATMAAKKYPSIFGLLRSGRINLSAVAMIGPLLTGENYRMLLRKACRRSFRELQALVAEISPQAARRDVVRVISVSPVSTQTLMARSPLAAYSSPIPPPPLPKTNNSWTDELFGSAQTDGELIGKAQSDGITSTQPAIDTLLRFSFDGSRELDELMERARSLLRHKYPKGERGCIVLEAMNALLDRIDPERRLERRIKRARTEIEARGNCE